MKKTIISLAVAAGMAASSAAFAEATVYGNLHLSIDSPDNDTPAGTANTDSLTMNSNTSALGVKGSEDLGDGMKAFFKAEFQLDPSEASALTGRDQYIGLKGGMGTVKFGSMSTNYKQMGGKVDPMYRTQLEGRGKLQMQSFLHGGSGGRLNGRAGDLLQYASPKMGGMQLVINTTFDDADTNGPNPTDIDETVGVGFRYEAKAFMVYVDMIDLADDDGTGTDTVASESATKVGATFDAGPVKLGVQLEQTEDLLGADFMMISANYGIDKNNAIYFAYDTRDDFSAGGATLSDSGSSSMALMYNHNMSKNTNVYVGYGSRDSDTNAFDLKTAFNSKGATITAERDYSVITAGMRVKF